MLLEVQKVLVSEAVTVHRNRKNISQEQGETPKCWCANEQQQQQPTCFHRDTSSVALKHNLTHAHTLLCYF